MKSKAKRALSAAEAEDIRYFFCKAKWTALQLAKSYGVSVTTIYAVIDRKGAYADDMPADRVGSPVSNA